MAASLSMCLCVGGMVVMADTTAVSRFDTTCVGVVVASLSTHLHLEGWW